MNPISSGNQGRVQLVYSHSNVCKTAGFYRLFIFFGILGAVSSSLASPTEDEVIITIFHKVIGSIEVPAVLTGDTVYVQPADIFNFIKIRKDVSADGLTITGEYIDAARKFTIDFSKLEIVYLGRTIHIEKEDYIQTTTGRYLRSDLFQRVFTLKCEFDFSRLAIEVSSDETLPAESIVLAEQAQKKAHSIFQENFIPDRDFGFSRSLFSLGAFDYSAGAGYSGNIFKSDTNKQKTYSVNLLAGGQIFDGDFDISTGSDDRTNVIALDRSLWQWRYTMPSSRILNQIVVGQRAAFANLQFSDTLLGIEFTNANLNYRTSYSNYTISDYTDPDWTVELYVNDGLVSYTKADPTGYYKFIIPLPYGTTRMTLKFRGPYGEVRTKTTELRIPYTFLPPGEIEYTLLGGKSLSTDNALGQLDMKFGISPWLSLAGGTRYIHDNFGTSRLLPYASTSVRLTSDILVSGEYFHRSGIRSSLSMSGFGGASLNAEYDHPFGKSANSPDEVLILDQRKLQISVPLPVLAGSVRLSGIEIPRDSGSADLTASSQLLFHVLGGLFDVSATTSFLRDNFRFKPTSDWTGNMGFSYSLSGLLIRPIAYINYSSLQVTDLSLTLQKPIGSIYTISLTAAHSFIVNDFRVQADIHMLFPFTSFGVSGGGGTNERPNQGATLQGSMLFDPNGPRLILSDRPQVRHGAIDIIPFLDTNNNGRFDPGEKIVKHFGLEQPIGRVTENENGTLSITELDPYRRYLIRLSASELDNISWVPKFQSFAINPAANGVTVIEVPIVAAGQIEGYVNSTGEKGDKPLGGVRILIRHRDMNDTSLVTLTQDLITFTNGEYYYLGLTPGKFRATIDPSILSVMHLTSTPPYIDFELKSKEEGDMIEGLNFIVK